jgi:hypothetical protein
MNDVDMKALLVTLKTLSALQLKAISEYCDSARWTLERNELQRLKEMSPTTEA